MYHEEFSICHESKFEYVRISFFLYSVKAKAQVCYTAPIFVIKYIMLHYGSVWFTYSHKYNDINGVESSRVDCNKTFRFGA